MRLLLTAGGGVTRQRTQGQASASMMSPLAEDPRGLSTPPPSAASTTALLMSPTAWNGAWTVAESPSCGWGEAISGVRTNLHSADSNMNWSARPGER